ncbi:hypothetical protein Pfo_011340 [Paulownia fortunei]|nr:hypothetical protein Pfo_011340 [Paulownia fortunei]
MDLKHDYTNHVSIFLSHMQFMIFCGHSGEIQPCVSPWFKSVEDIVVHADSGHRHGIKYYCGWSEVGKRIVLPTSFIGGPRDMCPRYLDALAIIQEKLYDSQRAHDRLDLISRVFRAKLQDLKYHCTCSCNEISEEGIATYSYVDNLKSEYKTKFLYHFDKFAYTKLSYQEKYPKLYDLIAKHMMHGPCEDTNLNNSCMVDGNTIHGKDGYPVKRRRKKGLTIQIQNAIIGFNLIEIYPVVINLQLHLPNQQCMTY